MINFSHAPLQSDLQTLKSIAKTDENLLKALDKEDVERLQSELKKANLVPQKVLVQGQHGTYWSTRLVNPGRSYIGSPSKTPTNTEGVKAPSSWKPPTRAGSGSYTAPTTWNPKRTTSTVSTPKPATPNPTLKPKPAPKPKVVTETDPYPNKPKDISQSSWDEVEDLCDAAFSEDDFLDDLKDQGVSWKESSDEDRNLYRAKVALCRKMQQNEKQKQEAYQAALDNAGKAPDKAANSMLQDVLSKATPEQKKLYKLTGICAGDKQAESYIRSIQKNMLDNQVNNTDLVVKSKLSTVTPDSNDYNRIVKSIEDTWEKTRLNFLQQQGGHYKIHAVYKIEGLNVETGFQKIVKSNAKYSKNTHGGKNAQIDTFFHGAPPTNVGQILGVSGQFKILKKARVGSMFGRGIYLASNSSKSAEYLSNRGGFFVCEASLGNAMDSPGAPDYWDDEIEEGIKSQYDSICADVSDEHDTVLMQPEYVVYSENAVIPRYVVDMEITYDKK